VIRPNRSLDAIPTSEPFIGPERLMRERGLGALLRLGANESAFGPSPLAVAAMAGELPHQSWYGDPDSFELREALAKRWSCTREELLVTSGIDDLLGLVVRCYLEPGESAVASAGTYPTFAYHAIGHGGRIVGVPYREDGRPDLSQLVRAAHSSRATLCYLANPDNPSGSFFDGDTIARLRSELPQATLLLLDEAYGEFVDSADALDERVVPGVVRARTFSKVYGLAGARIGYAVAPAELLAPLLKVRLQYGVNRNAQIGGLAALHDASFVREVVAQNSAGLAQYVALGRELGVPTLPSRTNFLCFDFATAERAAAVLDALLARGVWTRRPGVAPLDRYVRVTVGDAAARATFAAELRAVSAGALA